MAKELSWSSEQTNAAIAAHVDKMNRILEHAGLQPETLSGATAGHASAE